MKKIKELTFDAGILEEGRDRRKVDGQIEVIFTGYLR